MTGENISEDINAMTLSSVMEETGGRAQQRGEMMKTSAEFVPHLRKLVRWMMIIVIMIMFIFIALLQC